MQQLPNSKQRVQCTAACVLHMHGTMCMRCLAWNACGTPGVSSILQPVGSRPPTRSMPAAANKGGRQGQMLKLLNSCRERTYCSQQAGMAGWGGRQSGAANPGAVRSCAGPRLLTQRGAGQRCGGHVLLLRQARRLAHGVDQRALARVLRIIGAGTDRCSGKAGDRTAHMGARGVLCRLVCRVQTGRLRCQPRHTLSLSDH